MIVIGGAGFIGTRLCLSLKSNETSFYVLDKNPSKEFPVQSKVCDVRDLESLMATGCASDTIVNLAAEHRDDVRPLSLYDEVNVLGAENVCEFAEQIGVERIIFTSTVAVYGFAEPDTGEDGKVNPFNDYGRTKYEAELVYRRWQERDPKSRSLVVIRPTVVFGEGNRGNVYNLLSQIARGTFVMIGSGKNRKSMAYVENVCAFIRHCSTSPAGVSIYNYIDKPDFSMNELIILVKKALGKRQRVGVRIPYIIGIAIGRLFDIAALVTKRKFPISHVRIQKFCKDSVYSSAVDESGFSAPVALGEAIDKTIRYEFIDQVQGQTFISE